MELSDVSDYTFDELKQILEITSDTVTKYDVRAAVQHYLDNYEVNDAVVHFLKEVEYRMVSELTTLYENQKDIVDQYYHEKKLVEAEYFSKDVRNPKLGKVINRLLIIDSQYAEYEGLNTDFICHLTETVSNVLSFSLYSYSIPYSYYNIGPELHNDKFDVELPNLEKITITIPPALYNTVDLFLTEINLQIKKSGFLHNDDKAFARFDKIISRITLDFFGSVYNGETIIDSTCNIIFFESDKSVRLCKIPLAVNISMGTKLGFTEGEYAVDPNGIQAEAMINLAFTQYYVINIDDFSQHQIKTNLLGINPLRRINRFELPSFYLNHANQLSCHTRKKNAYIDETIKDNYPRSLTQNQLYATNEILQANVTEPNYLLPNPLVDNSFAVIPLKKQNNISFGDVAAEIGGTLQDNKRVYTGPTTLSKLQVTLKDDIGHIVNLNGLDWSIILKLEIWADQHELST